MNKDLEIIKNEIKDFGEQSIQTSLDIIIAAAERMAEERMIEKVNPNIREYHAILGEIIEIENYYPNTLGLQLQHIKEAAERMAAEIEQLKKANSGLAETFGGLSNEIIYYKHEIARLKAELEKRPEVVFCKNCKKRDICSQIMRFPLLKQTIKKIPVNYCSLGQRREREEGK